MAIVEAPEIAAERAGAGIKSGLTGAVNHTNAPVVEYAGREIAVPTIDHAKLGRPVDKQFERNRESVMSRIRAIGVTHGVVVNFLPIPLRSDSLLGPSRVARIPFPTGTEEYALYVFPEVYIEPGRRGADEQVLANEWHPIQMAIEFAKINPAGVFVFLCPPKLHPLDLLNSKEWRETISTEELHGGLTYGAALERSRLSAIAWMQRQLAGGLEATRTKQMWTEPQKASARRLHALGRIKELPKEVDVVRALDVVIPQCPKCQRPSEPNAAQCTNVGCGYIIDPRRAYEISAIGEDDPSLERLTREVVTEMGISNYVAETIDEKPRRMETGTPKPLSVAAAQLRRAQDQYEAQQAKKNAEVIGSAIAKADKKDEKGK